MTRNISRTLKAIFYETDKTIFISLNNIPVKCTLRILFTYIKHSITLHLHFRYLHH